MRFAQEGARVFAVDKNLKAMDETLALIHRAGGEVTLYTCDVTDSRAIAALVAACTAQYGGIDVLVNNVGVAAPGGPVRLSEENWDAQIDINLKTVFLMCKHVMPVMEAKGAGAIVNIASTSGIRWTGAPQVGYAAAKAGVIVGRGTYVTKGGDVIEDPSPTARPTASASFASRAATGTKGKSTRAGRTDAAATTQKRRPRRGAVLRRQGPRHGNLPLR